MIDPSSPGLLAVTGASGKTGWRVVQEALGRGYRVRAIVCGQVPRFQPAWREPS
jgi:uncharacterized protein YbjT (DUF2867 family)